MARWEKEIKSGMLTELYEKGIVTEEIPKINGLEFYESAFAELTTCRAPGTGTPIPFTAISEYARCFDVGDFEDFVYFMRRMDNAILKVETDRVRKETKEGNKDGSGEPSQTHHNPDGHKKLRKPKGSGRSNGSRQQGY